MARELFYISFDDECEIVNAYNQIKLQHPEIDHDDFAIDVDCSSFRDEVILTMQPDDL